MPWELKGLDKGTWMLGTDGPGEVVNGAYLNINRCLECGHNLSRGLEEREESTVLSHFHACVL